MSHTLKAVDRVESSLQVIAFTTRPAFKAFVGLLRGQNAPKMGTQWAHFTCWCTPNGLG